MQNLELSLETKGLSGESAGLGQSTIGAEIRRLAELQPDHAAVVASGFAPLSYRELQYLIDEVRAALRLAGFGRSARIAIAHAKWSAGCIGDRCSGLLRREHSAQSAADPR